MSWVTKTERFERITHTEKRAFKCRVCGKRGTRSRTFGQTLNPWNKNECGEPKMRHEIAWELECEGYAWDPDPVHTKCEMGTDE